ncbi:hypothetical protein EHP00_799 [Ecytonucleospora hepatopenaei]|uniref:RRM domain-containing protein n=1 Tax=Ecytonucleospora hepatopenaei TaxID=646526 RepID=A0A1W0E7T9_9MICR|nr:hypothetical protein EHP00_799 [Ecytonucleospora hepatopenaei]
MAYYPRRNRYKRDNSSYERNEDRFYNGKSHNSRNFRDNERDDRNNLYRDDYKNDSYNSFSNNRSTRRDDKYSDYDKYERKPRHGNSNYDRRNMSYKTYDDKHRNNFYDKHEKYYRDKHTPHFNKESYIQNYDKNSKNKTHKPTFKYFTDFNKVTNEFNKSNNTQNDKNNMKNSYLNNIKHLFDKKQKAILDLVNKIENMPKPIPKVVTNAKENSLVMSHLSCYTTEEDVYELLVKKGITLKLSCIVLMMDRQLGLCKGVGFINCYNFKQAQNVFNLLQNESIKDYPFYIDFK